MFQESFKISARRAIVAGISLRDSEGVHFFRALRIMGPNTSRAITRMMSSSQIMGLRHRHEAREFLEPVLPWQMPIRTDQTALVQANSDHNLASGIVGRTRSGQTPRQTLGQLTLDLRLQALIRWQVFQVLLAELFTHVYTWRSDVRTPSKPRQKSLRCRRRSLNQLPPWFTVDTDTPTRPERLPHVTEATQGRRSSLALGAGFRSLSGWAFGAVLYETSTVVVVVSVLPAESVTTSVTM